MLSHYEVLGVAPEASQGELRKQYQQRALELHPDKPDGSHKLFTRLQEAWAVLADPHHRVEYDRQLRRDQLYQQYPVSEELFLEDLECSGDVYSHRCRCGGHCLLPMEVISSTTDTELAVLCDNCSLAVMVLLPPQQTDLNVGRHLPDPNPTFASQVTNENLTTSSSVSSLKSTVDITTTSATSESSGLSSSASSSGPLTESSLKDDQQQGESSKNISSSAFLGESVNIETKENTVSSKPKTAQSGLILPERIGLLDCDVEETGSWSSNSSSSGASQTMPDQSTDATSHPQPKHVEDT